MRPAVWCTEADADGGPLVETKERACEDEEGPRGA